MHVSNLKYVVSCQYLLTDIHFLIMISELWKLKFRQMHAVKDNNDFNTE